MASSNDMKAAIAVTRFGLGARPGQIDAARSDPEGYLRRQIQSIGADQPQRDPESSAERLNGFRDFQQDRRQGRRRAASDGVNPPTPPRRRRNQPAAAPAMAEGGEAMAPGQQVPNERDPVQIAARLIREGPAVDFAARAQLAANTPADFRERWTLFWCNHFTVSGVKLVTATLVGPFEQEAIRPRVFGTFEELLISSTAHPGMLLYLDQAQSTGPHSMAAGYMRRQAGGGGLNENLAREILELHTVGLGAGYTQNDVTEFARALTGWSVGGPREAPNVQGRFTYRQLIHEPGARTVMGKTYADTGGQQALAILRDLAASPHTARHIATKLAVHFVSETPPASLVTRLEQAFLTSGGRLDALANALISAPEAWEPTPMKFKNPYEFLVSSWRMFGQTPQDLRFVGPVMNGLGQRPFNAPSPKGWPEEAANWAAPDAIIKRMAYSEALADRVGDSVNPMQLARSALGDRLNPNTATAISRAETRKEGLAILMMSPEFQRR